MNNIGVYLTEQQIRNLVREELISVLIEQEEKNKKSGIFQTIKKSGPLVAALLGLATMAGHSNIQASSAGQGTEQTAEQGPSLEQQIAARGMKPEKIKEMLQIANLNEAQIQKLYKLLQLQQQKYQEENEQIQGYVQQLEQLKADPDSYKNAEETERKLIEKIKKLEERTASGFYSQQIQQDEELLQGFLKAGLLVTNYLVNKKEINFEDMNVQQIQNEILKYSMEQSEGILFKTAQDDIDDFNKKYVKQDFFIAGSSSGIKDKKTLALVYMAVHNNEFAAELTQNLDKQFTSLDAVKKMKELNIVPQQELKSINYFIEDSNVWNETQDMLLSKEPQQATYVTSQQILDAAIKYQENRPARTEYSEEQIKNMSDEDINKLPEEDRQAVKAMKASLKENKLNKIRQRLNELRGVYV